MEGSPGFVTPSEISFGMTMYMQLTVSQVNQDSKISNCQDP